MLSPDLLDDGDKMQSTFKTYNQNVKFLKSICCKYSYYNSNAYENRTLLYLYLCKFWNKIAVSVLISINQKVYKLQMAFWLFIYFGQPPSTQLP